VSWLTLALPVAGDTVAGMDRVMATCSKCKAKQDVSAEAKKVHDGLPPNTFGAFAWQCENSGR